jgi:hypothetical protein
MGQDFVSGTVISAALVQHKHAITGEMSVQQTSACTEIDILPIQ